MVYTIVQYRQLAKSNPTELIQLINNISNIPLLVSIVEVLDEIDDESLVLPVFKRLLKHIHAQVREGALTALFSFYKNKKLPIDILDRVKTISKSDPSPDVRDYASDLLAS